LYRQLLRVSCLLPAVVAIGFIFRGKGQSAPRSTPILPWFLLAFAGLVVVNSLGYLGKELTFALGSISRGCLLCAISALGVRTSLEQLTSVGPRPLLAMVFQTVLLAVFSFVSLRFLYPELALP